MDTCDPTLGCVHIRINCNDDDACTIDSCDSEVGCVHTAVDCSGLTNASQCLVGVCNGGTCTAQSTCTNDTICCGGICAERCECTENDGSCTSSGTCCDGCCIINPPTIDTWIAVCQQAGLDGNAATLCAQAILDGNYPSTCFSPNQLTFNAFPGITVTLPCAD